MGELWTLGEEEPGYTPCVVSQRPEKDAALGGRWEEEGEAGVQNAAEVVPSYGGSVILQEAGQGSPQDGGGVADQVGQQSGAHERKMSHLGWAQ